ncbi:MAG: hypothetical protein QW620_07710 [Thermoplasmata archaeon]
MSDILVAIFVSIVCWLLGGLVIFQAINRKKEGKKIWKIFNEVATELGLTTKEDTIAAYGFPNILGKIKGRRVFIHIIVGKGMGGLAKTAYAVEHKIRFDNKVLISSTNTLPLLSGAFKCPLNIYNMSTPNYLVMSESKNNENIMNSLFTPNVVDSFNSIVARNSQRFLSLLLESGIAILYTFGWEEDKGALKANLSSLLELVEQMEKNATFLDSKIDHPFFSSFTKKSYSKAVDIAMSLFITILAIIILGITVITFQEILGTVLLLNIGILLILIGTTRIYAATKMKE